MSDIKLGITLTADGGGLVGEVRASKQELDKLGNSSQTAGNKSRVAGKKIAMMGVAIKKTRSFVGGLSNQLFSLKGLFLSLGAGVAAKSFVSAASAAEQYRVRLTVLLGSQAEGNRLFEEMADFAGKVPFEYEKIMSSATQLSGVMSGGVDEIKQWMPLIGDLAATSGLSIEQTTEQVIRMYSAGAGAADLFRDRGITAMLGFEFGVSYSAEQTRKKLMDEWTKMDSQFGGATGLLAGTWSGMLSMMSDKWFRFRTWLMDGGLFDYLKAIVIIFNNDIDKAMKDSADQAENWSMAIINGMENATTSVGVFIDGWHGLKIVFAGLKVIMWGFAGAVNTVAAGLSTMLTSMINGLLSWVKKALSVLSPFNKTAAEAYAGISNMQAATAVAAAGMQDIADQTVASIIASKLELHNLAMELPSDTIKQKLKEIRDQFDLNRKKSKQTADEGKKDAAGMGAALSNLKQDALDLESGLDGFGSGIKSGLVTVENAASGAARSFENDWGKAVRTGKLDFSSFVDSVLDDLRTRLFLLTPTQQAYPTSPMTAT